MRDLFEEIWGGIKRNKLRTALTGFAVAWGIFMLIVLLGAGNGLVNAFSKSMGGFASNTMTVGGGYTSKPYDGLKEGRSIRLDEGDVDLTASELFMQHIDEVGASVSTNAVLVNKDKHTSVSIEGDYPSKMDMDKLVVLHGRFINDIDISERRKVIVLPQNIAESLLRDGTVVTSILGKYVKAGNISFKVVGILKSDDSQNDNTVYAPFSTIRSVYAKGNTIDQLAFTFHGLATEEENEAFEKEYKAIVNLHHRAAPDDERALWIWNRFTQEMQMQNGMHIITVALWIIGLFTLLGGIVGVSNIMLITVKERTHEFGIRKAIGASPASVMWLIITESVAITAFFGYIGMALGMFTCQLLDKLYGQASISVMDMSMTMFVNPTVGFDVALEATVVLIVAGTLAGLIPARKAALIRPIEALRSE